MTHLALRLLLLGLLLPAGGLSQVVCYHCFANSTTAGQFCSIDRLCTGTSCYFNHEAIGGWSAGCSSEPAPPEVKCTLNGIDTDCTCQTDFCNSFKDLNATLHNFWTEPPHAEFSLIWPEAEDIICQECGNLTIGGLTRYIPCDEFHLCTGHYCVTKRGQSPHSYCGSVWEGTNEGRCFKNPGEDEQCVCPQPLCNAVLPTEAEPSTTTTELPTTTSTLLPLITTLLPVTIPPTTTAEATTTTSEATTSTTTPPTTPLITEVPTPTVTTPSTPPTTVPGPTTPKVGQEPPVSTKKPLVKKCKSNIKFSPNAQAVMMGEKLKQVITGGFGTDGKALQEFQDGIDTHICVYEEQ